MLDILFIIIFVVLYVGIGGFVLYEIYFKRIGAKLVHDVQLLGLLFAWPIVVPITLFFYSLSKLFKIKNKTYLVDLIKKH